MGFTLSGRKFLRVLVFRGYCGCSFWLTPLLQVLVLDLVVGFVSCFVAGAWAL